MYSRCAAWSSRGSGTTATGTIPKAVACLWDTFLLAGLPCLASVGEDVPNIAETWCAKVGELWQGALSQRKRGEGVVGGTL